MSLQAALSRLRARADGEEGFTIIEMMVALMVLAVGVLGMAPLFLASLRTAALGANRARALALATRDVEAFHSVPYCQVGFGTSQPGFATTWTDPADSSTYSTVTISDPNANIGGPSGPDETVAGVTYHFARYIVWAAGKSPGGGTTYTQAYKRVAVFVTWSDQAGSHTARQDSDVYPGGLGTYVAANCGANGSPGTQTPPSAPTNLTATTAAGSAGQNEIDLSWTKPSVGSFDKYVVALSTDGFATSDVVANNVSSTATSYAATGLTPSTSYSFQIYAVQNATGYQSASGQASATTLTAGPSVNCTVGLVTFTPTGADQTSGSTTLVSDVSVSAHTTGTCAFLQLVYTSVAGDPNSTNLSLVQSPPGVWKATMNGTGTNWSIGNHVVAVADSTGTPLVQGNFIVCSAGKTTCP
ncbi:MAG: fibronectin type III domain-containing protein [Acidimicrobiia bacterium]|nr:fibronectin type III domain-containing protein [Acidimicrobiia bacterium]